VRPYRLVCRVDSCEQDVQLGSKTAVDRSEWGELSPFSMCNGDKEREMRAYCPEHSLPRDSGCAGDSADSPDCPEHTVEGDST